MYAVAPRGRGNVNVEGKRHRRLIHMVNLRLRYAGPPELRMRTDPHLVTDRPMDLGPDNQTGW